MNPALMVELEAEVDLIEEIRLRIWAREHYAPSADREETWHPVVLDEMSRKDRKSC